MILEWNPARPKKKATALIKESLESGAIIGYPTDTFYGLGCDLFNIKAIKTLYAMRGLSEKRPLSIIFKDIKDVSNYAVLTDFAFHILKSTLPGAYTFILKAKRIVPRLLMTSKKEVGVRMPNHPVPPALVGLLGRPIINTTAKLPGRGGAVQRSSTASGVTSARSSFTGGNAGASGIGAWLDKPALLP